MNGFVHILEEIKKFRPDMCMGRHTATMQFCIMCGQLETTKWFFNNGCSLHSMLLAFATTKSTLHILKWLIENKCPMPSVADVYKGDVEIYNLLVLAGVPKIVVENNELPFVTYCGATLW